MEPLGECGTAGKSQRSEYQPGGGRFGIVSAAAAQFFESKESIALRTLVGELIAIGAEAPDPLWSFELGSHVLSALPTLALFGGDRHHRALDELRSGRALGGHAISELSSGSDATGMQTVVRHKRNGSLVLTGAKHFVSNGMDAEVLIVYAREALNAPPWASLSAFLIPTDRAGVGRCPISTIRSGERLAAVTFDDVALREADRIGEAGEGFAIMTTVLAWERSLVGLPLLGMLERRASDRGAGTLTRTRARSGQLLTGMLIERLLDGEFERSAIMLKLAISRLLSAEAVAVEPTSLDDRHFLAEAVAVRIYSGTDEVLRDRLGMMMGLPR